ncbi:spermine oxidase-like [Drosophila albomicans]|uniref:Spermine oxidase-like n=1 Tax=Drosophila albomicans TaxID=7291 RepID=A0A6P8WLS3_DROAB|nr:spermine oxidase-like [Drosophila albomicans]
MGSCYSKKTHRQLHNRYHASKAKTPKKLSQSFHSEPNIVILGAGAAGLACAMELKKQGFQHVRILEMSDRIGGRIRTMKFADNYIDVGAQWVNGKHGNVVYQMVKGLNLLDTSSWDAYVNVEWIRSNGQMMPRSMLVKLVKVMRSIVRNQHEDLIDCDGTYGEYLVEKFAEALSKPDMKHIDREWAVDFLRTFKKMEGSAVDTDMNAADYGSFRPCQGDGTLNWRDKGYKQFLRVLVDGNEMNEHGLLQGCIDLNSRVLKIDWDRIDGTIQITCENKNQYLADHVVITASLGVLKKNPRLFFPNLPLAKRKAINFMGFGHVCKIFAEFEEPFWKDDWTGFNAMWCADDLNQPQLEWLSDIYSIQPYAHQPRVLLGWAAGPNTEIIESIDSKLLTLGIMLMLRKFLPKMKVTQPKCVVTSHWSIDPAHMGSYSYPSMLTKSYNTGPDQLAQPVNVLAYEPTTPSYVSLLDIRPITVRPIILFAGEATSSDHYSTVHGAVETGIREARRLAGYYQKDL